MKIKKIITHPGIFHADDIFAIAWVLYAMNCKQAAIHRQNPAAENLSDPECLVVDVGGLYEPALNNYDHHQKEGAGIRKNGVPYAAFGRLFADTAHLVLSPLAARRVDEKLVQPVDAADCGYGKISGDRPLCSISAAVATFNPVGWVNDEARLDAFHEAVRWAGVLLDNFIKQAEAWAADCAVVVQAATLCDGAVLILPRECQWQEHVVQHKDYNNLLYVIAPSARGGWIVQQVPVAPNSFVGRKPLPENWRGLRGAEFAKQFPQIKFRDLTNVFCHNAGFICGADSKENALALAAEAVRA